jgi:hypothetical protein
MHPLLLKKKQVENQKLVQVNLQEKEHFQSALTHHVRFQMFSMEKMQLEIGDFIFRTLPLIQLLAKDSF